MNATGVRLKILGDDEIESLYGRPHFTDDERLEYFALSPTEKATLEQLEFISIVVCCASHKRRHHRWPVYGSPMCRRAPQNSWI